MGIQDVETSGPVGSQVISTVNRYALGARGVDMISPDDVFWYDLELSGVR